MVSVTLQKLLISGRDSGTARFINTIANEAEGRGVEVCIVAQEPSASQLRYSGRQIVEPPYEAKATPEAAAACGLLDWARQLLDDVRPDMVLTTISGTAFGIDEALLHAADATETAVVCYQGYWGNVNHLAPRQPDLLMVADREAASLTRLRLGAKTPPMAIVGSLIAEPLGTRDWRVERATARTALLGLGADQAVLTCIMLQPLAHWPGYVEAVQNWAGAAAAHGLALFLPHPSDPDPAFLRNVPELRDGQVTRGILRIAPSRVCEYSLGYVAAADIVAASFSSSLIEAAYIASRLPEGQGPAPVYLLPGALQRMFCESTGLSSPPFVNLGCALLSRPSDRVTYGGAFLQVLELRGTTNAACRRHLKIPQGVARRTMTEIEAVLRKGAPES